MNTKSILLFIAGMVVGGAAGVFGSRAYYKKKFEIERNELEDYYQGVDKYARVEHDDESDVNPVEHTSRDGGRMSPEERREIREKLRENWAGTTNYAKMYQKDENGEGEERDPEPSEGEFACIGCLKCVMVEGAHTCEERRVGFPYGCDEFVENDDEAEQMFDEHQKNKNKPPRIISAEAYGNLPSNIDQQVLYFYAHDEVLADENEEYLDNPGEFVGNCLEKYDFIDSDERIIFVMNYALSTCYEIQKVDAAWHDTH